MTEVLPRSPGRRDAALVGLLAVAALALRLVHLNWGFPEIYEEATPVREAVEFWGQPGRGLDLNPHFFKYPSLSFYLNFLAQAFGYFWLSLSGSIQSLADFRQLLAQDPTWAVRIGRTLSAVLGALTVLPAVALGRALGGRGAGLAAGAILALLPMAVRESQLVSPDVPLLLAVTAGLAAATRWAQSGERRFAVAAGIWMGLAAAAKYPGALLVVAVLAAHALAQQREGGRGAALLLSGRLVQVIALAAVAFVVASPYVILDLPRAIEDIAFERRHMALGHFGREDGRAWGYYLFRALPEGLTVAVALAAVVGALWLLVDRRRRAIALPSVLFAGVVLLVLGSWRMAAPRYVLPVASAAAAWAAVAATGWPRLLGMGPRAASTAAVAILVILLAPAALRSVDDVEGRGREDSRTAALAWIEAHVPYHSAILLERYGPEPDPVDYVVSYLPFHSIDPHVYDAAYAAALYSTFDLVVFSSGVSARYLADIREYPIQSSFYAAMERGFEEAASFTPGLYAGPEIRILRRRPGAVLPGLDSLPPGFFPSQRGNQPLAEYLSGLGTAIIRRGESETGFRLLDEAVVMDPKNAKVWGNLGAMQVRAGRLEEALAAFRRAREADPADAGVVYNMGVLYDRMGEPRQAADAYQEAIGRDPAREEAYLGLARALVEDDRYDPARAVLQEFLRRFPRSERREQAEQALAEMRGLGPGRP